MSVLKQQLTDFSQIVRGYNDVDTKNFNIERSHIYQELFFNNFISLISPCFPILRSILPGDLWHDIIKEIFTKVQLRKNIFHQISFELVAYLEKNSLEGYPFAYELAHYEWLELELELKKNELNINSYEKQLNVLNYRWKLSSCAVIKSYKYDVHNIGSNYQPKEERQTNLIIYRADDKVQFIKISLQSSQLLQCILYEELSAKEIISQLCSIYENLNQSHLLEETKKLLVMLFQEQVIYYTQ